MRREAELRLPMERRGGSVTWALEDDPGHLAPFGGVPTAHHWAKELMYDSLMAWERDMRVVPALAMSWEMPDDKTYIVKLRRRVTFHNGSELTAEDVKYSIDLQQDPPPPGRKVSIGQLPEIEGVEALDRYTVRVSMRSPDPSLPGFMAWGRYSAIVPKGIYDESNVAEEGVGTGPFQLVKYEPRATILYVRNTRFWKPGLPHLASVALPIIPDEEKRISKLLGAEIDGGTFSRETAQTFADHPNIRVLRGLTGAHRELQFTVKSGEDKPWHDKRVRQAVNHLIDRDSLIARVYGGDAEYSGIVPPGYGRWPISDEELRTVLQVHDLERAMNLLADAGCALGFTLNLLVISDPPDAVHCAETIKNHLWRAGIDCRLEVRSSTAFFEQRDSGDFEAALTVRGVRGDISGFVDEFAPEAVGYKDRFSGWSNAHVAKLIATGRRTMDEERRLAIYRELQRLMLEECVHIPLCQPYKYQAVWGHLCNMYVSYSDFNPGLREVWVDDEAPATQTGSRRVVSGSDAPRRQRTRRGV